MLKRLVCLVRRLARWTAIATQYWNFLFFQLKYCIFLLTRRLYLVRSLSHEIDCKISPVLPLWESTPGASIGSPISLRQALGVEHDATFCFSRFHQGKSFGKIAKIRILWTNLCAKLPRGSFDETLPVYFFLQGSETRIGLSRARQVLLSHVGSLVYY